MGKRGFFEPCSGCCPAQTFPAFSISRSAPSSIGHDDLRSPLSNPDRNHCSLGRRGSFSPCSSQIFPGGRSFLPALGEASKSAPKQGPTPTGPQKAGRKEQQSVAVLKISRLFGTSMSCYSYPSMKLCPEINTQTKTNWSFTVVAWGIRKSRSQRFWATEAHRCFPATKADSLRLRC